MFDFLKRKRPVEEIVDKPAKRLKKGAAIARDAVGLARTSRRFEFAKGQQSIPGAYHSNLTRTRDVTNNYNDFIDLEGAAANSEDESECSEVSTKNDASSGCDAQNQHGFGGGGEVDSPLAQLVAIETSAWGSESSIPQTREDWDYPFRLHNKGSSNTNAKIMNTDQAFSCGSREAFELELGEIEWKIAQAEKELQRLRKERDELVNRYEETSPQENPDIGDATDMSPLPIRV